MAHHELEDVLRHCRCSVCCLCPRAAALADAAVVHRQHAAAKPRHGHGMPCGRQAVYNRLKAECCRCSRDARAVLCLGRVQQAMQLWRPGALSCCKTCSSIEYTQKTKKHITLLHTQCSERCWTRTHDEHNARLVPQQLVGVVVQRLAVLPIPLWRRTLKHTAVRIHQHMYDVCHTADGSP